ncbi:MAG: NAD(P)-dependent oxidoreductase [Phascolarctobacterium sp.]|nr:NAD(P)-dependent oxidoreductase [Phascolarctobacterium sp.]
MENFNLTEEQAIAEAKRCWNCPNPQCVKGCPVHTPIPKFIHEIVLGNYTKAAAMLLENNIFSPITCRVCAQEKQCEGHCVQGIKGKSIAIGALEQFVHDYIKNNKITIKENEPVKKNGQKIAVVGGGPSGLTFAHELSKAGYAVTVFEKQKELGGVLRYGIPKFRLSHELINEIIDKLKKQGVQFRTSFTVNSVEELEKFLQQDGYAGVYVATGTGKPMWMDIPGEKDYQGVDDALAFLAQSNSADENDLAELKEKYNGKTFVIIGAGNVAMDAARVAKRLGAAKVTIVYRRSEDEMPARRDEIQYAKNDGVEFQLLTNPTGILGNSEKQVTGIKCVKMELGEPDASGRRSPIPVPNSEFVIATDYVIYALGQSPEVFEDKNQHLATNKKGNIIINEKGETNIKNIYSGGDVVTGPDTVVEAVQAAKVAAEHMCK